MEDEDASRRGLDMGSELGVPILPWLLPRDLLTSWSADLGLLDLLGVFGFSCLRLRLFGILPEYLQMTLTIFVSSLERHRTH